jgi:hypothetical protein
MYVIFGVLYGYLINLYFCFGGKINLTFPN